MSNNNGTGPTGSHHHNSSSVWDANAEIEVADAIDAYLQTYPAPADSVIAHDLREWAERLGRDGRARLWELDELTPEDIPSAAASGIAQLERLLAQEGKQRDRPDEQDWRR